MTYIHDRDIDKPTCPTYGMYGEPVRFWGWVIIVTYAALIGLQVVGPIAYALQFHGWLP